MNFISRPIFLVMIILFCISCNPGNTSKPSLKYFDLAGWMKNQATELKAEHRGLERTITKDGKSETITSDTANWVREFQPFIEADLNKPAWLNSYETDSILKDSILIVRYTALEKRLPVRKMEITFLNKQVQTVMVWSAKKNSYFQSDQELTYQTNIGYDLVGSQKVILADSLSYKISGRIH